MPSLNSTPRSPWLNPQGTRAVFLMDADTPLEAQICRRWVAGNSDPALGPGCEIIAIGGWKSGGNAGAAEQLAHLLGNPDLRLFFIPLRVLWLPREYQGERRVRFRDLFLGDPRKPFALRQRWIYRREPDRCHPVAADGADSKDLVVRYDRDTAGDRSDPRARAEFILRQALLALERAERRERGARYKVPRLVAELVLNKPRFVQELRSVAADTGLEFEAARAQASSCLQEMAADHSTFVLDLMVSVSRFLYQRGFDPQIQYLDEDVARIRQLSQDHTVVFLMTHKSYLDGCVMASLVYELDLPPLHLFGGANLNFPGAGGFARRAGTIFIRRSFSDDAIYKLVIRHYIEYLIDKRFPLNWAFEGTRSRTGKLMPPRYGLLRYVADAAAQARGSTVLLVPVSISYDQVPDVGDFIAEQGGAQKKGESFGWLKQYISVLSKPYGKIHLRFGREIPVLEPPVLEPPIVELQAPASRAETGLSEIDLQKLAFQVAVEANRVTPITASSMICFALLAQGHKALTFSELTHDLKALAGLVRRQGWPMTRDFSSHSGLNLKSILQGLADNGILTAYKDGSEPVYAVAGGARTAAAYYRNTAVHYFIGGAIAELALLQVAELPTGDSPEQAGNSHASFCEAALALRDLLKFEFFFPDSEAFVRELELELEQRAPGWRAALQQGGDAIYTLLRGVQPLLAHGALRPFIDAYSIAADVLIQQSGKPDPERRQFSKHCMKIGHQFLLQGRVASDDSVNGVYFENFFRLADNRGLIGQGSADGNKARRELAAQLARLRGRMDYLRGLADSQRQADAGARSAGGDAA